MRVPIACTLTADAATQRLDEWRATIASSAIALDRSGPLTLEVRLVSDPNRVAAVIDLARREKACCEFFTFTVEIDSEAATLVVGVPADAAPVLDDFAAFLKGSISFVADT